MSREEEFAKRLTSPIDPHEVYEHLERINWRGGDCDYFQNVCIEYLMNMINDLRKRVDELEQRKTDNRTDK